MLIALDYDDTYTRDPEFWDAMIKSAVSRGHTVICATMRYDNAHESAAVLKNLSGKVSRIVFTGRKAKRPFLAALGIDVSVWIDDNPLWIVTDAAG